MRLRTRLFLTFSVLSLAVMALAAAITYRLTSSALISELQQQADEAAARVSTYMETRGAAAAMAVGSLSRAPALRQELALVASSTEEPGSPKMVGLAEETRTGTGLDVFEILDHSGVILSSAHWKANYGNSYAEAPALAAATQGKPTTVTIDVRGRRRVALASITPVEIGLARFILIGGYFMDADLLRQLNELVGVDVMLVPPTGESRQAIEKTAGPDAKDKQLGAAAGAPERKARGEGAKRAPQNQGAPGGSRDLPLGRPRSPRVPEGASLSKRTHVIRDVYPPHAGGARSAKLIVGVSRARLDTLSEGLRRASVLAALAALALSWIAAFALARRMTRPIERLTAGARRVAAGDLTARVSGEGPDEVGQLVAGFNKMLIDLKESKAVSARMERIAAWREVARRIAHEIKNALSPIQLSIENVQRSYGKGTKDFDAVLERAAKTVGEEVEGLRAMVDEFSQLARMPAPTLIRHDVREVARRVVDLHRGARPNVGLALDAPDAPVEAEIDPGQLSRALGNIVANAMEACTDGGDVSVRVVPPDAGAAQGADKVRIEVRDTGAGLTREQMERVFEPYYTTKEGGTGLGLAIVMKIITDHRGSVEVDVEEGPGSIFTILLPAREAREDLKEGVKTR